MTAVVVRLERSRSPADLERVLEALASWLRGPDDSELRRAFVDWVRLLAARLVPAGSAATLGDAGGAENYTETLGFQLKHNIPLGEHAWITVVSEEAPEGTELVLEPDAHPAARPFKRALVEDGIPWTSFAVDDVEAEHDRLVARGVRFVQPPTDLGTVITAVFDDSCGNLIQIAQEKPQP